MKCSWSTFIPTPLTRSTRLPYRGNQGPPRPPGGVRPRRVRDRQVLLDHRASTLDVFPLLADGGDVIHDALGRVPAREASDHPRREIVGGEAAPGRGDVPVGDERLLQDPDPGFFDPRLRRGIGAGRDIREKSELREHERPGALGADDLARRVQRELPHQAGVAHHVSRAPAAADDDRVGLAGEAQGGLGLDDDPVHRGDPFGGAHDQGLQALDPVEHGRGDERIELVEAFEGKHRDPHTASGV